MQVQDKSNLCLPTIVQRECFFPCCGDFIRDYQTEHCPNMVFTQ